MAVKDLIGPGFVGTSTVEYIVTRGMTSAAIPPPGTDVEAPCFIDYSITHSYVDGVIAGTYTSPTSVATSVNCLEDVLSHSDIQGSLLGLSPGDVAFIVWGLTAHAKVNGTLLVDGVTYMVIGVRQVPCDPQQRLHCRKQVS